MEVAARGWCDTGCRYNNSSEATIGLCGPPGCADDAPSYDIGDIGDIVIVNVLWGDDVDLGPDNTSRADRVTASVGTARSSSPALIPPPTTPQL
jgi:hypothetical protein